MIHHYEKNGGKIPAQHLISLAEAFVISVEEFLGLKASKRLKVENKRLLNKLKQLEGLPSKDRESVLRIIDSLVIKNKMQHA